MQNSNTESSQESQTIPAPDEAQLIRERREKLKAENDAFEAERLRAEKLRAEAIMGGKGMFNPDAQKPKEESAADYAKRLISKPYGDKKIETPE